FFLFVPPPPISTLFPYTTLFRSILKRSAVLSFAGSISYHTPFLRESVGGDAEVLEVAPATRESARAPPPRLAAHAAVTEELKNSRVGGRMGNLNAVYSSRFSNPIPPWISWFHPRSLRVLCKLRCAPSCRRARSEERR